MEIALVETGFVIISYAATFGGIAVLVVAMFRRARSLASGCRQRTARGPEPAPDAR